MRLESGVGEKPTGIGGAAFLQLGFRPFFLGASVFAVVAIAMWTMIYLFGVSLPLKGVTPFQWHAHEMIYGYSVAVIAGFLLTAAGNWTGRRTLHGVRLLLLFACWAGARVLMLFGSNFMVPAAVLDTLFVAGLLAAIAMPVCRARQWRQLVVLSVLPVLGAFNLVFYLGAADYLARGVYWGVYGGLYLVVGLILIMGRRVIPFFIERGVGYSVALFNARWVDNSTLVLFVAFFVVLVFVPGNPAVPWISAGLFFANVVRLAGWHTPGIWRKPLLWSLFLAYASIVAGFGLLALSGFQGVSRYVAVHAFAYGGIGLITLSMMARVALGHTGRDVHHPPSTVWWCCVLLAGGILFRVLCPVLLPQLQTTWIGVSQILWLGAFTGLAALLFPMLTAPRPDGRPG